MALCRVYTKPDGSVSILHPNPRLQQRGESDQDFLERICAKDAAKIGLLGLPSQDVERANLPDRRTRKDWELREGALAMKEKRNP